MADWRYRIALNKVIEEMNEKYDLSHQEDPCPQEVLDALSKEVSKAPPLVHFVGRIKRVKTVAALNRALSEVFDEADRFLVWTYGDMINETDKNKT